MSDDTTIHIIAGPTASGKSETAMQLAEKLDGVIINCDSQQIYDGLPLLSAQPSDEDKERVPHRLYAELHPNDVCSAGNYRELAEPVINAVIESGKTPIICAVRASSLRVDGSDSAPHCFDNDGRSDCRWVRSFNVSATQHSHAFDHDSRRREDEAKIHRSEAVALERAQMN